MKIVLVENEPLAAERLGLLLKEYDPSIEIMRIIESVEEAVEWFNTHPLPDLLFLDIELADGTSFNIFEKVTLRCPVIFTTAYDQYAIEAFTLFSIDYLLKPVTLQTLAKALNKYTEFVQGEKQEVKMISLGTHMRERHQEFRQRFLVKIGVRMFFIEARDISYFYAEDKNVFLINSEGARFPVDYSLERLQEMLDPRQFFRLNRKILCGIWAIKEIKVYLNNRLKIFLHAGKQLDEAVVSRERVSAFKAWAEA